jgi:hypothetical protein
MADYTPVFSSPPTVTRTASAAITGRQLLAVTGSGTVGPATAGSTSLVGVAAFDCASGARITVWALAGAEHELLTSAAVTAGNTMKAGANGTVVPWVSGTDAADLIVGRASTTAASGALVRLAGR